MATGPGYFRHRCRQTGAFLLENLSLGKPLSSEVRSVVGRTYSINGIPAPGHSVSNYGPGGEKPVHVWRELVELAANEEDRDRLLALVSEIHQLLEQKQKCVCVAYRTRPFETQHKVA